MPKRCVYCDYVLSKDCGRSYHRFPTNEAKKNQWALFVKNDSNWMPAKEARLCGSHFVAADFKVTTTGKLKLKSDAIPSVHNRQFTQPIKIGNKIRILSKEAEQKSTATIESLNENLAEVKNENMELKKKISELALRNRDLTRANTRLRLDMQFQRNQVKQLNSEIKHLKQKEIVEEADAKKRFLDMTLQRGGPALHEIVTRALENKKRTCHKNLEDFCLTARALSPRCYKFIRSAFNNLLLSPSTIKRRFSSLEVSPGIIHASIRKIGEMNAAEKQQTLCSVSFDEIHIRNQALMDGKGQVQGYLDYGGIKYKIPENTMATSALFFYAVAINSHWKLPVAYFLTNGLDTEFVAKAIVQVLTSLHMTGVRTVDVTFDGLPSNLAAVEALGANFSDYRNLKTFFPHPCEPKWKVYAYPDPPHMFKLMRSLWNGQEVNGKLVDANKNVLHWATIRKLHNLQTKEGLRAANKLSTRHVMYENQKMKVSLATQLFSQSMSSALIFCEKIEVLGPEAIPLAAYLDTMDRCFDLMNSRHPLDTGRKAPLSKRNEFQTRETIALVRETLYGLQNIYGQKILDSRKKTGPLGILIGLRSLEMMLEEFVYCPNPQLQYLLTYKLNQDHLEIYFSMIRSCCGFNNNPNVIQLTGAIRKTLLSCIPPKTTGNCLPMDETAITRISTTRTHFVQISDVEQDENTPFTAPEDVLELQDHDYLHLSSFTENVTTYIGGNICKKLLSKIKCEQCKREMLEVKGAEIREDTILIQTKQNGGLLTPSKSVTSLCKLTETTVRQLANGDLQKLNLELAVNTTFRRTLNLTDLFPNLHPGFRNTEVLNHRIILIKMIIREYAKIRMHHFFKEWTKSKKPSSVRNQNNKNTLFQGM